jgi:hypothetical protein
MRPRISAEKMRENECTKKNERKRLKDAETECRCPYRRGIAGQGEGG